MAKPLNPDDACDLEPDKLCDNCCRCIDQGEDYGVAYAYAQFNIPLDEFIIAGDKEENGGEEEQLTELDIDPELMAEWESKLALAEDDTPRNTFAFKRLRGARKKV